MEMFGAILISVLAISVAVLLIIFVLVPVLRGLGWLIGGLFKGVGWLVHHIFQYIAGTISDIIRFFGSVIAQIVMLPLVPLSIVIGRWSAANHFAQRIKGECKIGSACVYRVVLKRPLQLLFLDGLLEGLEQRVPEAMHGAPTADLPGKRAGQFDGYTIVGSLRAGGSGAKLYIAHPTPEKIARAGRHNMPERVVIKTFALTEGSSLPQIVRESRALECAKQLGLVLDHGMDNHRFFYVMPYHPGDHLGILTRQMHGEVGTRGLDHKRLQRVMSYMHDLLTTLATYHRGGLWHKDIKPENVIVHDGRAHVVDLGLVTPLKSAMTLTTHGTEYFRDPEMVRQALRGVKVHQVDGAKFDVYAAGAVLYFMIENTFPAHGGLSRFTLNSPESLRWIVRRAMTEYNQRYETAEAMLGDLEFVMRSSDPFAVKPGELPSMRGGESSPAPFESDPSVMQVAKVNSNLPPRVNAAGGAGESQRGGAVVEAIAGVTGPQGWGLYMGPKGLHIGKLGPNGEPVHASVTPPAAGTSVKLPKPKLSITNWWTGSYRVESIPGQIDPARAEARAFREQAYAFRQQADEINRQARAGAMSARKAAREQIKAARQRAKDIRSRALAHRHRVAPPTSGSAIVIGTLSVLFLGTILAITFFGSDEWSQFLERRTLNAGGAKASLPVVMIVDAPEPKHEAVRKQIDAIIAERRKAGYDVVVEQTEHACELRELVMKWQSNPRGSADQAIEDLMAQRNLYGVLYVNMKGQKRDGSPKDVNQLLIRSTRPGAASRRWPTPPQPPAPPDVPQMGTPLQMLATAPPALPYLLINDHPAKIDPAVEAEIESAIKAYRARGWTILIDDDTEVAVRKALPTAARDPKVPLPAMLEAVLAEHDLGGVLRIDAAPPALQAQSRIVITRIDRDHVESSGALHPDDCLPEGGQQAGELLMHPKANHDG